MRFAACLTLFLFVSTQLSAADETNLRRELDRAYSSWRDAIISRDLPAWQQTTASYRQLQTRNLIVSQKQPFPEAMFALPIKPPETTTLRFLKSEVLGETAHLVYFGKVDVGLVDAAEVPECILILKFIKEANGWKFDTTRMVNLVDAPEALAALQTRASTPFLSEPVFNPSGVVPATAKPCPQPDRVGVLRVVSFGYETQASVNGFEVASVQNNAEEHIIIGGLNNGENPLTLNIKPLPIPDGEERVLEIDALVLTGSEKKPTYHVFSWKPDKHPAPAEAKLMILV
ncbi:MAG: hypothetical protein RL693_483, partial [Verrucomicrobiota bacterium]